MNELEKELLQTFKNFVIQYALDKKEQNEQTTNLVKQIESLNSAIKTLTNRVNELENAYHEILTVLEE